ncbi:hypothetical protein GTP46_28500 [Duganella sp. FT135W]|uniref:Uncharacterized protein n=1 Tax=Duganella flavida TaxID=2692175 RepID=A0A6L8KPV9_9BURK|nr:hypothetical protein [Duganella flavida]MYM26571.1 hypothetical protein [Duganella flavida]
MTTKVLTFRISMPVYADLCATAAELGVPVAAHVRRLIEREHQAEQITQLRSELLAKLEQLTPATTQPRFPALDEILLLSRATASHLNAQIVAQVRAKLANQQ